MGFCSERRSSRTVGERRQISQSRKLTLVVEACFADFSTSLNPLGAVGVGVFGTDGFSVGNEGVSALGVAGFFLTGVLFVFLKTFLGASCVSAISAICADVEDVNSMESGS